MKFKFDRYICAGCNNLHTHTHAHKETHIQSRTKKVPCLEMCLLAYTTFTTPSLTSFYHFILHKFAIRWYGCVYVHFGQVLAINTPILFVSAHAHCNRAVAIAFPCRFLCIASLRCRRRRRPQSALAQKHLFLAQSIQSEHVPPDCDQKWPFAYVSIIIKLE